MTDTNRQIANEMDQRRHYLMEAKRANADEKQSKKFTEAANRCGERIRKLLEGRRNAGNKAC